MICFEYISRDFIRCFHTFRLYTNYVLCFQGFGKVYETKKYGLSCANTSWLAYGDVIEWLYILLCSTILSVLYYYANYNVYRHGCLYYCVVLIIGGEADQYQ